MHQGPLVLLRMWLVYAKPWQQAIICAVLVGAGAALVALTGQPAGLIPAVFGILFLVGMVRRRSGRA